MTACEKEESFTKLEIPYDSHLVPLNEGIKVENDLLVFANQEHFEKALKNWHDITIDDLMYYLLAQDFESFYASAKLSNSNTLPDTDPFLLNLLNKDSQIKIGTHIFELDFENKSIKAFKNGQKEYKDFTFEDDVFSLLNNSESEEKSYCSGRRVNDYIQIYNNGGYLFYECWIRYYKAGIYNSLYTELDCTAASGVASFYNWSMTGSYKWASRNNNGSVTIATYGNGDKNLYFSIYRSTNRLKSYETNIHYEASSSNARYWADVENNCN